MKTRKATKWLLLGSLALAGCSQEDMADLANDNNTAEKEGITATVKDFEVGNATRTTLTLDETTGLKFTWASSDLVGVFGSQDDQQVKLTIKSGADSNSATFTSNDFQLSSGSTYRAYFPMTDTNTASSSAITLDYTGQTQTANASTAHLGDYDFLVSDKVTPTATNTADFTFSHLGAAVRLRITLSNTADAVTAFKQLKYTNGIPWAGVELYVDGGSTSDFITKGTLNLFGDTQFTTTATTDKISVGFSGIETTADGDIDVWLMLAPVDLTGKTIRVMMDADVIEDYDDGTSKHVTVYSSVPGSITGRKFEAGKAYHFPVTISNWSHTSSETGGSEE